MVRLQQRLILTSTYNDQCLQVSTLLPIVSAVKDSFQEMSELWPRIFCFPFIFIATQHRLSAFAQVLNFSRPQGKISGEKAEPWKNKIPLKGRRMNGNCLCSRLLSRYHRTLLCVHRNYRMCNSITKVITVTFNLHRHIAMRGRT